MSGWDQELCPYCSGGQDDDGNPCSECGGSGWIMVPAYDDDDSPNPETD